MASRDACHRIRRYCAVWRRGESAVQALLLLVLCLPVAAECSAQGLTASSRSVGCGDTAGCSAEACHVGGLQSEFACGQTGCLPADDCAVCRPACGQGAGRYVFADALFWTVREGSADNWAQVITPNNLVGAYVGTATLVDAPFDWNAGFRVGMGQRAGNGLEGRVSYTNFSTRATSQAAGEVFSAFLGNFYVGNTDGALFGPHYRSADVEWDFDFHTIDFELRREVAVAPNLVIRPFVGLKTAIISQSVHSNWRQPIDTLENIYLFDSATEDLKQDFWGIGPSVGVDLEIPWYTKPRYTVKLFGTPSASLMFGHWTFSDVYRNDGPTSLTIPTVSSIAIRTSPITGAATMISGAMGVEWTQYFARATTTVRLGYEAQVWLNQMQFYSYNMGRLNNLMSLHGGVLELRIDY